jgi:hypothetical protein
MLSCQGGSRHWKHRGHGVHCNSKRSQILKKNLGQIIVDEFSIFGPASFQVVNIFGPMKDLENQRLT